MNENPNIHVPGYGTVSFHVIKAEIVARCGEVLDKAKQGDWKGVNHLISDKGVISLFLKSAQHVENHIAHEKDKISKAPRNESPMRTGNSNNAADIGDGKKCPAPKQWEDFRKQLVVALSKVKDGIDPVWLKHLTVPHLNDQVSYPLVKAFEYSKDSVNRHVAADDLSKSSWTDFDEGLIVAAIAESYSKWVSNFKFTTATPDEKSKVSAAGKRAFALLTKR
jgi:hypothetical protein